mmetsp:Transcript_3346/g.5917  ORF Transcript_3346/g.5917 Transcript_3346/m.5917 type:complete len:91 (-) Transcript_3346:11-283(-)
MVTDWLVCLKTCAIHAPQPPARLPKTLEIQYQQQQQATSNKQASERARESNYVPRPADNQCWPPSSQSESNLSSETLTDQIIDRQPSMSE